MTASHRPDQDILERLKRPVTLAEACAGSGVKSRTLQFWTLNDVIECTPETRHGGPGVRRKYAITEVAIAAIIEKFADTAVSVGGLRLIASALRSSFNQPLVYAVDAKNISFFPSSLAGENVYILIKTIDLNSWEVDWGVTADFSEFSVDEAINLSPPNSWGAVFVFKAAEIFRNIPNVVRGA